MSKTNPKFIPEDPWPNDVDTQDLTQSAIAMNEMFISLMAGGFTENQALTLVAAMVKSKETP